MAWTCFLAEPTGKERRFLRRYSNAALDSQECPTSGSYHDTMVALDEIDAEFQILDDGRKVMKHACGDRWPHDDPRWPKTCECGYVFLDTDRWQLFHELLYRGPTGDIFTLRRAPTGAMWDAWWYHGAAEFKGPDGKSLVVMLPDGLEWVIDGPAKSGGHWTRTGEPPKITASPSILTSKYHGFLREGVLTDDLDGRKY